MLPHKSGAIGSFVQHEIYKPSETEGVLIYFSCKDAAIELDRLAWAGRTILEKNTEIGVGHDFLALFKDARCNRIALHSNT